MLRRTMMAASGGGGGSSLHDLILADTLTSSGIYLRLNDLDPSTVAVNLGSGGNGSYGNNDGQYDLGEPAIYSGGPVCLETVTSAGRAIFPGESAPSLEEMTIGCVWRRNGVGTRMLMARDRDSGGGRYFQFRQSSNGLNLEFVKIPGTVQTATIAHGMGATDTALVMVTVSAAGAVKIFKNGTKLHTASFAAANYGGSNTTPFNIGNRHGANEGGVSLFYSEAFILPMELSEARVAEYGAASGL